MRKSVESTWSLRTLGSLLTFLTSGSRGWAKYYVDDGDYFLRIQNVQDGRLSLADIAFVHAPDTKESVRTSVKVGDVLLSITADLGRTAVVPKLSKSAYISQHLAILRPSHEIDSRYLSAFLESPGGRQQFSRLNREGVKDGLNFTDVRSVVVPLPPLAEQRRIAAILDKADAIRRKRQEAIALTEELLRSTFLDMFGDPVTNPKGWETKCMGDIASFVGGGTPSRSVAAYFEGDICWATSKDMKGEVLADTKEHITPEAVMNSATKLVPAETILVVVKSKVLMHRLPVLVAGVPTCFGQDLKGIVPGVGIHPIYLARHMRIGQRVLLAQARGVNTEGLTLDHLSEYKVMIPSSDDVMKFVEFENQTNQFLRKQQQYHREADNLFHSLVQRAFRGDL